MNALLLPRTSLLATAVACSIAGFSTVAAADDAPPPPPTTATIGVDVATFRNEKGALGCRLFASGAGFPQATTAFAQQRVAITGKSVRCTFANVPPGTYAIAVLHDENQNGKLDTNFIGAPTEGYGVSNNHTSALSGPKWDESKFNVEKGKDLRFAVSLRY